MTKVLLNKIEELQASIEDVKVYVKMLQKQNSSELVKAQGLLAVLEAELVQAQNQL